MFKRKQRPTVPTTPPNFLDLRNPAQRAVGTGVPDRVFADISAPLARTKFKLTRALVIRAGAIAASVLVLGTGLMLLNSRSPNPFNAAVLQKFKTQSYYPVYLPKGYKLQSTTAAVTGGALTFVASNSNSAQTLFFSEQLMPRGTDLQGFYQTQVPDAVTAATSYGSAVIGHYANISPLEREHLGSNRIDSANVTTVASLATPETWILITAPSNFSVAELKQIVLSLRK